VAGDPTGLDVDNLEDWDPIPVLLPAAIFRQVLFDSTEFPPAWLPPRPPGWAPKAAPASAPTGELATADVQTTEKPAPAKRTRQRKTTGSATSTRTRTKRVAKPAKDPPAGAV
jgi:hypothetical protein